MMHNFRTLRTMESPFINVSESIGIVDGKPPTMEDDCPVFPLAIQTEKFQRETGDRDRECFFRALAVEFARSNIERLLLDRLDRPLHDTMLRWVSLTADGLADCAAVGL